MSQIDRRLQNVQQADLSESRVNDDFVLWLKTWGQNILLVVLAIAALAMGWHWWQQRQERAVDAAWVELANARLPAALREVAARNEGNGAISAIAELRAADAYLGSIVSNQRFDREPGAADAAVTPELRAEWLTEADALLAKVQDRTSKASGTGQLGLLVSALFGRAAVAEDRGDLAAAEGFLKEVQSRTKDTDFSSAADVAARRIDTLRVAAGTVTLPAKPVVAAPPAMPGGFLPGMPTGPEAAPADPNAEILRQLQGGSAPAPAAPAAPAGAAP
jgi:predicted negative regulator of RcsB-dependent stress response